MAFVDIAGVALETRLIPGDPAKPWLVFLHEGLGSVSLWRDFPDQVARRVGGRGLIYSRQGYGQSDPLPGADKRRPASFMHDEALKVLPALLAHYAIEKPVLIGHSDGASIALIHAATSDDMVTGLVLMAPHVIVEPVSLASIAQIKDLYAKGALRDRLARHHTHVDDAFLGWADTWLDPAFATWSLEPEVARLSCPVLLIQGEDDEYGTLKQLDIIEKGAAEKVARLVLPACGHSPQRDKPAEVIQAIATFVREACA
jgi:pimeloyl-ACP methyl ester carboxylesterase